MKVNWKQKLTSRKFWAAIVAVVVSLCVLFGVPNVTQEQITALVMAVGGLIASSLGEGFVDAARLKAEKEDAE